MINFQYARADDVADAVRMIATDPAAKFIAGGTNLIDLMKENVERPSRLIDISRLLLKNVEETPDGGLRIGALVSNSDRAWHPLIEQRYPLLSSAIFSGCIAGHRVQTIPKGRIARIDVGEVLRVEGVNTSLPRSPWRQAIPSGCDARARRLCPRERYGTSSRSR